MGRKFTGLLAAGLFLTAFPLAAADQKAAKDFLTKIYESYRGENAGGVSLDDTKAYFTPALAALIDKDIEDAAAAGEVGRLDGDPFVGAQDWSIESFDISITPAQDEDRASATVSFKNLGDPRTVRLDLIHAETIGWRIDDIRGDDGAFLREILKDEKAVKP